MDLPAAARANHHARVELDSVFRDDGLLSFVTLRPVRRAGDRFATVAIFDSFARRLRSEVYRNIRAQRPGWTDHRIRQRLRVSIFMFNGNNEGRTTNFDDVRLPFVNGDIFLDMFDRATAEGSNVDLDIYDVAWKVWVNPASLIEGATQVETIDEEDDEKMNTAGRVKYMRLKNDDGSIGCAAHALAIGLDLRKRSKATTKRHKDARFTAFCKELQTSLGFEDPKYATVFEMQKFIELYPEYRLVILQTAVHTPIIYTGFF